MSDAISVTRSDPKREIEVGLSLHERAEHLESGGVAGGVGSVESVEQRHPVYGGERDAHEVAAAAWSVIHTDVGIRTLGEQRTNLGGAAKADGGDERLRFGRLRVCA